jgi:hypothetical protein
MTEKSHWPFDSDTGGKGAHASSHSAKLDSERARAANQAAFRQRLRNDRLIVGGRAHTKKSGLS